MIFSENFSGTFIHYLFSNPKLQVELLFKQNTEFDIRTRFIQSFGVVSSLHRHYTRGMYS